jgi:NAD(P)-dependent dehydrogenase (short-subunit alcohol dehydrogenase family)
MLLQDKVALVTGGNSGIGRGIVHRFLREGAAVAIAARDRVKGAAVLREAAELGGEAAFFAVDLAQEDEVAEMIEAVLARFGRLEVVVNNAGLGSRRGGVEPTDPPGERWRKLRGPNLDAPYFVSAHALPILCKQGGGAMVNISSTAALHGNWGLYGVAKAGVEALTRSFAAEGGPHGVRVNGISPGWIATEQDGEIAAAGSDDGAWELPPSLLNRMGLPAEIAAAAAFLASEEASFITGQTLIVDGGLTVVDYPSMPLLSQLGHRLRSRPD